MTAREFKGGHYTPNHVSFGRMMVSEQLRPVLTFVAGVIAVQAKANTEESSKHAGESAVDGQRLADNYRVERGPIVVIMGQTGLPGPRISERVVNRLRHAAAREFGKGGHGAGKGTRDLRSAGQAHGDLAGEPR